MTTLNTVCAISGMPIGYDDDVVLIVVKSEYERSSFGVVSSLPIFGKYDTEMAIEPDLNCERTVMAIQYLQHVHKNGAFKGRNKEETFEFTENQTDFLYGFTMLLLRDELALTLHRDVNISGYLVHRKMYDWAVSKDIGALKNYSSRQSSTELLKDYKSIVLKMISPVTNNIDPNGSKEEQEAQKEALFQARSDKMMLELNDGIYHCVMSEYKQVIHYYERLSEEKSTDELIAVSERLAQSLMDIYTLDLFLITTGKTFQVPRYFGQAENVRLIKELNLFAHDMIDEIDAEREC